MQRQFDQKNKINENKRGALARSDDHEKEVDSMTIELLKRKGSNL